MIRCVRIFVYFLLCAGILSAQTGAPSGSASSTAKTSAKKTSVPDPGAINKDFYRNAFFGFSYRIRYGWVDRTTEMNDDPQSAGNAAVLLGIFERPPMAVGETVNSAVVIAAESASAYPGLRHAAQYFGPLTEVTSANGLTPVNEVYDFPVDGRPIERRDFMKKMAGGVTMHQSTLAWLAKGYVLSFTFIGSSDDEVTSEIEFLSFGNIKTPPHKP